MTIKRVGIVGFGDHGLGHRRGRRQGRLRGRAAQPRAERPPTRWSPGSRSRWPSRSSGASSTTAERDAVLGRVRAVTDLGELADCDLVIESIVEDLAAKKHLFTELDRICTPTRDPRHQHVDAPGRRDGDGHRPPRPGVRHPLLQPGADDGARRGRARDHDVSDETIADGHGVRRRRAARTAVQVKDQAGFIVNALLFPYLNNAVRLLRRRRRHRATTSTPR